MAQIIAQSALMPQMVSAGPIKPRGSFSVVKDAQGEPIIFFVASDDLLHVVYRGPTGNNLRVVLSPAFGVKGAVSEFAVSQDAAQNIYLVFTSRATTGKTSLNIVRPVKPEAIDWQAKSLAHLLVSGQQQDVAIKNIYLGPTVMSMGAAYYPLVFVGFRGEGAATDDIRAVAVQESGWHFKEAINFKDAMELPENPKHFSSMVAGRLGDYSGLFVLYQMSLGGAMTLGFLGFDETELADPSISLPTLLWIPAQCPAGANSLAVTTNSSGSTSLIIGGNGLFHFTAEEALSGMSSRVRTLSKDNFFDGIKQLHVAQDGEAITLWALNASNEIVYQQFDIKDEIPVARTPAVPLLSESEGGGHFSALYNSTLSQKLYSLGKEGQVTMLMQDDATRFWQKQSVNIPTLDEYVEFQSYTTQIRVTRDGLVPVPNAKVCLSCSPRTEVIINGLSMPVGLEAREIQANEAGIVTILANANDLGAPIFKITEAADGLVRLDRKSITINPMTSISEKLGDIKSADGLRNLKTEDGTKVIDSGAANDDSLKDAASAIQDLHKNMEGLPLEDSANAAGELVTSAGKATQRSVWDFWPWLSQKISQAKSWALEKLDQGFKFVLKLAKGVWEFVVDTATKAYKAMTKVFEAIGAGLTKLLKALGDFFGWNDIIDTKNILVNVLNLGMLWGHTQIDGFRKKVNNFFEEQKKAVASLDPTALPDHLKKAKVGKDKAKESTNKSSVSVKKAEGPTGNFGSYQMDHGDTGIEIKGEDDHEVGDLFGNMAENLKTAIEKLKVLFTKLWSNIKGLFEKNDVSLEDLLLKLGTDLAGDMLNVLQTVVGAIIEILGDLFAQLAIQGNKVRKVPVLSTLYKRLTGNDLTIIDAMMLVISIPATFTFKALSGGKKPKDVEGMSEFVVPGKYWGILKTAWRLNDDGSPQNRLTSSQGSRSTTSSMTLEPMMPDAIMANDLGPAHRADHSTKNRVIEPMTPAELKKARMAADTGQVKMYSQQASQQVPSLKAPGLVNEATDYKTGIWWIDILPYQTRKMIVETLIPALKRMAEVLPGFIKMIIPGIGAAWFMFKTMPGWYVDKGFPGIGKGAAKTAFYAVTWYISIPKIPNDPEEQRLRQIVHCFGLFKVATGWLPQEAACIIVGASSVFQAIALLGMQIKIAAVMKKEYSVPLAIEEWMVVLGKIAGSIAAATQGVEPISAVSAAALIMGGYGMKTMRITGLSDKKLDCSVDDGI